MRACPGRPACRGDSGMDDERNAVMILDDAGLPLSEGKLHVVVVCWRCDGEGDIFGLKDGEWGIVVCPLCEGTGVTDEPTPE